MNPEKHSEILQKFSSEITRRDFFAAFALAGLCSNQHILRTCDFSVVAESACKQADATIKEFERRTNGN